MAEADGAPSRLPFTFLVSLAGALDFHRQAKRWNVLVIHRRASLLIYLRAVVSRVGCMPLSGRVSYRMASHTLLL
jgi:hypothetical protein